MTVLDGYSTWTIETFEDWQGVHTQIRSAYDNTKGLDAWLAAQNQTRVLCANAHRGQNQRWSLIIDNGQWKSGPCVEEAVVFETPSRSRMSRTARFYRLLMMGQ